MKETKEFKSFMLYGINNSVSKNECISNACLFAIFSAPILVIRYGSFIFFLLALIPIVFYLCISLKLLDKGRIRREKFYLHQGIMSLCYTYLFGLIAMAIGHDLYEGKKRVIAILIVIAIYILVAIFYYDMTKRMIKRDMYGKTKANNAGVWATSFAAIGVFFGRVIFGGQDEKSAKIVACILFFILSWTCEIGIILIYKYYYLKKHPELLIEDSVKESKSRVKKSIGIRSK